MSSTVAIVRLNFHPSRSQTLTDFAVKRDEGIRGTAGSWECFQRTCRIGFVVDAAAAAGCCCCCCWLLLLLLPLVQWWSLDVHHYCTVMVAVDWRCCLSVHVLQCSTCGISSSKSSIRSPPASLQQCEGYTTVRPSTHGESIEHPASVISRATAPAFVFQLKNRHCRQTHDAIFQKVTVHM